MLTWTCLCICDVGEMRVRRWDLEVQLQSGYNVNSSIEWARDARWHLLMPLEAQSSGCVITCVIRES